MKTVKRSDKCFFFFLHKFSLSHYDMTVVGLSVSGVPKIRGRRRLRHKGDDHERMMVVQQRSRRHVNLARSSGISSSPLYSLSPPRANRFRFWEGGEGSYGTNKKEERCITPCQQDLVCCLRHISCDGATMGAILYQWEGSLSWNYKTIVKKQFKSEKSMDIFRGSSICKSTCCMDWLPRHALLRFYTQQI